MVPHNKLMGIVFAEHNILLKGSCRKKVPYNEKGIKNDEIF